LIEIFDGANRIQTVRQQTGAVSEVLTWDGRSFDGRVVSPGSYVFRVGAMDAQGNVDAGCTQDVLLEQAYVEPERVE